MVFRGAPDGTAREMRKVKKAPAGAFRLHLHLHPARAERVRRAAVRSEFASVGQASERGVSEQ